MHRFVQWSGVALVACAACASFATSQLGGGSNDGGGLTTHGGPAPPAGGTGSLPGGAPGVQRAPLNAEPGANRGARDPVLSNETTVNPNAQGGVSGYRRAPLTPYQIWQACMMKANPPECRERLRRGAFDDSIERNPP